MSDSRKRIERFYVEEAARLLDETWSLDSREGPDFLVSTTDGFFALEVTQVHVDKATRKGSRAMAVERSNADWLAGIKRDITSIADVPLDVKFRGLPTDASRSFVIDALKGEAFEAKPLGHRMERQSTHGKLWATRAFRDRWMLMNDAVGWVSRDPRLLVAAIERKARKLDAYRRACDDIRLLVVADRTKNSGKLVVDPDFAPSLNGFNAVYFLSYPLELTVWR